MAIIFLTGTCKSEGSLLFLSSFLVLDFGMLLSVDWVAGLSSAFNGCSFAVFSSCENNVLRPLTCRAFVHLPKLLLYRRSSPVISRITDIFFKISAVTLKGGFPSWAK